jgi:GNAT superfamily N-acetyltransferase
MSRPHLTRDLIVRPAKPSDADVLAGLVKQLNAHQNDPTENFDAAAALRDTVGSDAAVQALIAELDQVPVGYAFLLPSYESAHAARGLYVTDFFVTEPARDRGVGRALVAACAASARRQGKNFLWWVSKAWNVDAQAFYRKLGAVEEPVMAHALTFAKFDAIADEGEAFIKE